jgi:hypothetical protein
VFDALSSVVIRSALCALIFGSSQTDTVNQCSKLCRLSASGVCKNTGHIRLQRSIDLYRILFKICNVKMVKGRGEVNIRRSESQEWSVSIFHFPNPSLHNIDTD